MTNGGYYGSYGDPQSGGPPIGQPLPGGLLLRFFARLLDGIIVGVVGTIIAFTTDIWSDIMVTGLLTGLLMFVYFTVFEVFQGWTPGKKLLGLSVRGPGGTTKPDVRQSAIRNAFTLLTVIPFIGGLLAFVAMVVIAVTISGSATKQGKHDELAGGTQVVKG